MRVPIHTGDRSLARLADRIDAATGIDHVEAIVTAAAEVRIPRGVARRSNEDAGVARLGLRAVAPDQTSPVPPDGKHRECRHLGEREVKLRARVGPGGSNRDRCRWKGLGQIARIADRHRDDPGG